ncbi:MAG: hypothetical protein NTX85_01820 [Candidatus Nomurabacteria bacterium]|nr:hypothetical protein [Candidatus Nomurabacteria bacterium]
MVNNFEKVASSEGKKTENIKVGIPDQNFHKYHESRKLDAVNEKLFGVENKIKEEYLEIIEKINKVYEDCGDELVKKISKEKRAELTELRKQKEEKVKLLEDIQRQGGIAENKGDC